MELAPRRRPGSNRPSEVAMTLSYFFSDARFEDLFLPELTKAAEKRQHPLVIGTALEADVHFLHAACSVSKRLGFRL
ncbi:MAG: hypothetical protein ACLGG7_07750, partial [Bacteriovoracia bacterium]